MASNTIPIPNANPTATDETLSLNNTDVSSPSFYDLTYFLLLLFPFYFIAILSNFLAIYSILIARIYRQYLSNVLLAVISIGSLLNAHGQMFLVLLRWASDADSTQLCSSSYYLRDSGLILIHTHIFILAVERILANLKKHPANRNNNIVQRGHLFLLVLSLISIILALTIPIYTVKSSSFVSVNRFCVPVDLESTVQYLKYKTYLNWIYYACGHPLLWLSLMILVIFLFRRSTITYSTLIPMNQMILLISLMSCMNIVIQTLFDDVIGINGKLLMTNENNTPLKLFYWMNFRDWFGMIEKICIGVVFFLFRPEIRQWLKESMDAFRSNPKEVLTPQRLDIRNESEEIYDETNEGNLQFRADM